MNKEGGIIRSLYKSTVVSIVISAVAAMFGMLIDGVIICKFLGTDSMSAYGLVTPLFSIITAISGVLTIGAQVTCARHLGEGKADRARHVFSACVLMTAISYYAAFFVLLLHFRKPDILFRFSLKEIQRSDFAQILRVGAPTAVGSGATMVRNLVLNLTMVNVGDSEAVAALTVRNTMNTLFGAILLGIEMTTSMIAGMVYGEEDRTSARSLMHVSLRYALFFGVFLAVLAFADLCLRSSAVRSQYASC